MKICTKCEVEKDESEFYTYRKYGKVYLETSCIPCRRKTSNHTSKKWRENNREKARGSVRRWAKNNPDKVKKWNVLGEERRKLKVYGLTPESHRELLLKYEGCCGICQSTDRLRVDHDHQSGKVRGILCNQCNVVLGLFKDSADRFLAAAKYLQKFST